MSRITVAVDAMGGDQAPQAVVAGALAAAVALPDVDVILVGDDAAVRPCLSAHGTPPRNLSIQHASQVVEMCDSPAKAVKRKTDSSIVVSMNLVKSGAAHAVISAGNSGAMMAAAVMILEPIAGVDRPAIATLMPTATGRCLLLDAGATTDCKPHNLVQFAQMGALYAPIALDLPDDRPRVGLLSIGEEPTKGDELTKAAHKLLSACDLHFIGNVEPKEVVRGHVDVVVCDGFVGNLMLKAGEGFGELFGELIKEQLLKGWVSKLGALLLRPAFKAVKKRFDYAEYGGALLLGVNGVVVISHGRS
ncbi:MAG TPA: phosphate acyltransferase PlsX, partial [Armatimonadota bacterium]|nr:phosphate acyltransferase PlsX [Armatimonadota bacterium]